jgi:hypothetical protein
MAPPDGRRRRGLRRDAPAEGEVVVMWIPSRIRLAVDALAVRSMERNRAPGGAALDRIVAGGSNDAVGKTIAEIGEWNGPLLLVVSRQCVGTV